MISIPEESRKLNKLSDQNSGVLYIQVLEKIRLWILNGYVKEGEYLPSERELAALFDVSRMPVTQALKILEFLGVVCFVRGKGFCVKNIDLHHIINCIGFMVLPAQNSINDIQEVRESIEVQAATLAALRRTDEDLAEAEGALAEMEARCARGDNVAEASLRFHGALVRASHNDVLVKVNDFLLELLRSTRLETLRDKAQLDLAIAQHRGILKAVTERNSEKAGTLMREHLRVLPTHHEIMVVNG
ncbi:MAG: hypothetical protein BCS36_05905 [Desulfovibrio sp. MES5]|uniref:FadR/GntR family transcriptional regulator n=1 Tax=Desulfovibrio sp. MES5 TaxID=1899016 RepID=UPI000B9CAB57|nr:FadR/GntR family transcriptional regulator [Desulfovibrio sp. MES5]OXS28803.1 MAG: hypothetical protein BCS36_05905 [Desulfovibrio sp. MES5]